MPIQPRLVILMREASSERLTLRSARYSSAAEINIFIVENRIRRISSALARFEKGGKKGQIGATRRSSPPWYGFKANLAIASTTGYCGTLDTVGKEALKRNCGAEPAPFWG